ncbi:hypothetical protein PHYBLDRAFT_157957 [Phycomyces blakesleeanus NRRL 1555(-)]|uniref:Uncharacterized protein n=1 Tax=Phycomyces blakesleeanus (strain ATCC 8743b / DSM 1359 / FGSC 10004 / NBRC 33097 / NRRL 1555) TaxID=763407 RepID=A0A162U4J8_PHYB8|nr:hypothetical protein PHYBLDRAFT_159369 [Phycomyces blakesleeanus NRRL 1555(-)]XP_018291412.1 hypothetical protein PHYBLDRAFT_158921 [Phycomyces blakesleeanus NRRL 1555(-)]XP_018294653.1 hypothetical protein PHYBLDRAFT_157957 [Phycomyces blakesleeanus NRRL 1555(-)]OAD71174.1 hypothetical protein PHYBLDRAFT_159369 [Phycomyces blakesleeanus NRRL 1555(-)]OAD73372.1 hypothetical protein PHYBLDRAFT_158921 [Phycomyces blakesleeanus NRRL 1555(-)]OAD76613.1 hypothetical protein PHYBLDRAFT_157957 [Ph|eukprot:XP_018289214.1 hypothetical protein PHYBLDRAFT_159369 [Phycomyces blakesleeanus NRRL 1555(-)]
MQMSYPSALIPEKRSRSLFPRCGLHARYVILIEQSRIWLKCSTIFSWARREIPNSWINCMNARFFLSSLLGTGRGWLKSKTSEGVVPSISSMTFSHSSPKSYYTYPKAKLGTIADVNWL